MLPLPKLDDRSYDEIRDEAIQNIVKHCPEWTNHNASDPGITLIELFASMTEMLQYRLNRVPEKNYIAFLDMLGITGRLANPSKTRVSFKVSDGYELNKEKKSVIKIPKNTIIATDDDDPILFETDKETHVSNLQLKNIFSKVYDKQKDEYVLVNHSDSFQKNEGFIPFEVSEESTNITMLYLYDEILSSLKERSLVSILFRVPTNIEGFNYESEKNFLKRLDWEYFNGEEWKKITISNVNLENSQFDESNSRVLSVTFDGNCEDFMPSKIEDVNKKENYVIRAIVRESKKWLSAFSVYEISLSLKSRVSGIIPDGINSRSVPLDLNNDFLPFGLSPTNDDYFDIKSNEAFSKKGTKVKLKIAHSQNREYVMPKGYNDLELLWEYRDKEDKWQKLKVTDTSNNLTANGEVSFTIPDDMASVDINGEIDYWIKCKIVAGHYGKEEEREFKEGKEIVTHVNNLNPPKLSRIVISYDLDREDLKECLVYNNYIYSKKVLNKTSPQLLFNHESSKEQSLNFFFDSFISDDYVDLYFEIDEELIDERNLKNCERILVWKILIDEDWVKIEVQDSTDELTRSGDVRIFLPAQEDLSQFTLLGETLTGMWLKAEVKANALVKIPKIKNILTNTVIALQKESFYDEFIGKSIGLPEMSFHLNHKNIIAAPLIRIGEDEFKHVKRFIEYGKEDKVFRFYGMTGEIKFGDGKYGDIPSPHEDIYARYYATTLGKTGNVDSGKIINLRQSIPFVESIINIKPAIGGTDGDNLESLKKYAPSELKTRDRAITTEDYETLTKEFSSNIVMAKAIPANGDVHVIVVTKDIIENKGFINRRLIQDLEEYLKSKSLITVQPFIQSPNIIPLSIKVKVKTTTASDLRKLDLEEKLNEEAKRYFSLTEGGVEKSGYPLGKNITRADLYKLLNLVDNTLYFDSIIINDTSDKLFLSSKDVVNFEKLTVEELSFDG